MGFTKKQRREQKKYHAIHKVYARKVPRGSTAGNQDTSSTSVNTARKSSEEEQRSDK